MEISHWSKDRQDSDELGEVGELLRVAASSKSVHYMLSFAATSIPTVELAAED